MLCGLYLWTWEYYWTSTVPLLAWLLCCCVSDISWALASMTATFLCEWQNRLYLCAVCLSIKSCSTFLFFYFSCYNSRTEKKKYLQMLNQKYVVVPNVKHAVTSFATTNKLKFWNQIFVFFFSSQHQQLICAMWLAGLSLDSLWK